MMIEDRQAKLPEERTRGDFLEHIVEDMKTNNLLTSDLISYMMFGLLLATFETISTTLTLTVMLLTQHPLLVQELEDLAENNVTSAKNFIPFGEGIRLCPGAEFSKVLMTLFLNVLATKYSWSQVKPGEIIRAPTMGFGKGYYIKVAEKSI
ncbi:cytochrome P450 87A3 [Citrus sinensis]|uniref:Cytochrome P450 87A3 n=1 Tax=Citrus sinensis TaxID=2711 RepID=A0ACB8KSV7_CITSI|nr:cytochrome P450 87A3 [Citrus sinensis]